MRYFLLIFASVLAAVWRYAWQARHGISRKPSLYIFPDMEWQLKLRPQKENSFFTNGLSSQPHVPGTIARSTPLQTAAGECFLLKTPRSTTDRSPARPTSLRITR